MKPQVPVPTDWQGHKVALDQLRITHGNQLHIFQELDSKIETMLRLAVFLATGLAVFLTFAAERETKDLQYPGPIFWLIVIGAALHLLSFAALLSSYGALASRWGLNLGPDPQAVAQRALRNQVTGERELIHGYRLSIRANLKTYELRVQGLNVASASLVFAACAYLIGIYILALV